MERLQVRVGGMSCEHCRTAITRELTTVPGIQTVSVDLEGGHVSVAGNGIDASAVRDAIAEAGYTAGTEIVDGQANAENLPS